MLSGRRFWRKVGIPTLSCLELVGCTVYTLGMVYITPGVAIRWHDTVLWRFVSAKHFHLDGEIFWTKKNVNLFVEAFFLRKGSLTFWHGKGKLGAIYSASKSDTSVRRFWSCKKTRYHMWPNSATYHISYISWDILFSIISLRKSLIKHYVLGWLIFLYWPCPSIISGPNRNHMQARNSWSFIQALCSKRWWRRHIPSDDGWGKPCCFFWFAMVKYMVKW